MPLEIEKLDAGRIAVRRMHEEHESSVLVNVAEADQLAEWLGKFARPEHPIGERATFGAHDGRTTPAAPIPATTEPSP